MKRKVAFTATDSARYLNSWLLITHDRGIKGNCLLACLKERLVLLSERKSFIFQNKSDYGEEL
jgi:hypothetical protein